MALILLLCFILPLMTTAKECPNGVKVNMTCYMRSHLLDLRGGSGHKIVVNQLGILRKYRTLYYSYEPVLENRTNEEVQPKKYVNVRFINLDDRSKFGEISSSKTCSTDYRCFDFDQDNAIIYLGGSDGVKKLNTFNNHLRHYASRGKTILSIFFSDKVYFVRDNEFMIIFKKAGGLKSLLIDHNNKTREEKLPKITVKKFVITSDNTVVFISTQGLFAAKAEKNSQVYRLSNNQYFRGLAVDLDDEVYTWNADGIYKVVLDIINPAKRTVVRVANIPSIGALTFDNDNSILYTVEKSLFRLVKSE